MIRIVFNCNFRQIFFIKQSNFRQRTNQLSYLYDRTKMIENIISLYHAIAIKQWFFNIMLTFLIHDQNQSYIIVQFVKMRFGEQFKIFAIPEWKDCYLNYEVLKIFVTIIKQISQTITYCDDVKKQIIQYQLHHVPHDAAHFDLINTVDQFKNQLTTKINQENQLFYKTYLTQAQITQLFYQMKVIQIQDRYAICWRIKKKNVPKKLMPLFLTYIEYSYIQISYISEMREFNLQAERKILKKHKKYSKKFVETPHPTHQKINRMISIEQEYKQKIQDLYVSVNKDMPSKEARQFLRQVSQNSDQIDYFDYFFFGIGIGATIILLTVLIFIIKYENLSIQNLSQEFGRDFPTWRGLALFILYIWMLGLDVYFFEKYKISHRLIFKFQDHHYSSSSSVFKIAGFFTSIYMILFLIYILLEAQIITHIPILRKQYFSLILWMILAVYLVMPLPIFNYQGRLYAVKLIFKCIASPFVGVQFIIVWMTDQWVSLITPFRDLSYTICYYNQLDFDKPSINPCKANSSFAFIMLPVVIAIGYRILQCFRMGYQEKKFFMTLHMANSIKYIVSLVTAALSFQYNKGYPNLLAIWIIVSAVSTLYSYYWDLKNDWALLQPNSKNWLLRKYLTFEPKRNYYIVMVINLIMRLAWTLTLSPSVSAYIGSPALLTFVTGSIQIIRRGIWNLLRVQKEHLKNCNQFLALPDMKYLQKKIQQKLQNKASSPSRNEISISQQDLINKQFDRRSLEMREVITKSYIKLIKKKIEQRDLQQKSYKDQYQEQKVKQIKKIKKKLDAIRQKIIIKQQEQQS